MVRYSLRRTRDGAGDEGPMSIIMRRGESGEIEMKHNARPEVGYIIKVGSPYARSYQYQDYWQTTGITEILEETETIVKFKTYNSEYVWEVF